MDNYATLNDILVNLFRDIMALEEKAIITTEYQDITNNDMHVIDAIGLGEGKTMSTVAKALNVTLGTLTISVNSLVKKGYVDRVRSEKDRRVVLVSLTKAGVQAYKHHEKFHAEMIQNIVDHLETEEQEVLQKALDKLNCFFKQQ